MVLPASVLRRPPGFPPVGQQNQDERIGAVLQEGRHQGRAIIEPSSAGTFFSIFAIISSLSARIDSTFRAIETHFTPYFSKRNRLRCFTQAGYCFRKVYQFLENHS